MRTERLNKIVEFMKGKQGVTAKEVVAATGMKEKMVRDYFFIYVRKGKFVRTNVGQYKLKEE